MNTDPSGKFCASILRCIGRGFFIAILLSVFFLPPGIVHASQGAELAKEMIQKVNSITTEQELKVFLAKASQEKVQLSSPERINFAEYLYYVLFRDKAELDARVMLFSGGISEQEVRAGRARFLSSDDPAMRQSGENLDIAGHVKLPNGEMGQDMSLFDLALHDPKTPQDRLIRAMFKLAPVESAQWFADHTGLSADERAKLEPDLQKAWKMQRAVEDPLVDKQTKAILDDSVRFPLLDIWLHSPSWILRSLADGLLRHNPEWQMHNIPELIKAMQSVQVPQGLKISSN